MELRAILYGVQVNDGRSVDQPNVISHFGQLL